MKGNEILLAGTRAYPDDGLPRLLYADRREDNATCKADRDLAEFIRLQVESAWLLRFPTNR